MTIEHPFAGTLELLAAAGPDGAGPQLLFCENETNFAGLYGGEAVTPYPKDGINDHVTRGAATVNPVGAGHQVRVLVPGQRAGRADRRAAAAAAARRRRGGPRQGDAARQGAGGPRWARTSIR